MTLFERLRCDGAAEWQAYVGHPFVRRLGDGTLPEGCFRRYLVQDWLFLRHFARAYGLAASKGETLAEIAGAAATVTALIEVEMPLHVRLCAQWGIDEAALGATAEAIETVAYTRFVLERGHSGDLLDLQVALAPCVIGYAEIGSALCGSGSEAYRAWVATYAGSDYQAVAVRAVESLETVWRRRGSEARYPGLLEDFRTATRLEAAFWQMGLEAEGAPGMVRVSTERSA